MPSDVLGDHLVRNANVTRNSRPAWFMDIDETRIRIVRQESGIDPLSVLSKGYRPSLVLDNNNDQDGSDVDAYGVVVL